MFTGMKVVDLSTNAVLAVQYLAEKTTTPQVVDVTAIAGLIAVFVPLVVQVLVKKTASTGLKSAINLVGVAAASVVALWINPHDGAISWQLVVNTFITALVTSLVAYHGAWKSFGVAGAVAEATKKFGLGTPPAPELELDEKGAEDGKDVQFTGIQVGGGGGGRGGAAKPFVSGGPYGVNVGTTTRNTAQDDIPTEETVPDKDNVDPGYNPDNDKVDPSTAGINLHDGMPEDRP